MGGTPGGLPAAAWASRVSCNHSRLRPISPVDALEAPAEALDGTAVVTLDPDYFVPRPFDCPDQLVQLHLDRLGIPVLGGLDQEYHEERHDRRRGIDHQLPRVREPEQRPGHGP